MTKNAPITTVHSLILLGVSRSLLSTTYQVLARRTAHLVPSALSLVSGTMGFAVRALLQISQARPVAARGQMVAIRGYEPWKECANPNFRSRPILLKNSVSGAKRKIPGP